MYRYTLTVPRVLNDGTPVRAAVRENIESELLDVFGGYTVAQAVGAWRGAERDYREPVGVYTLDADEDMALALDAIAARIAAALEQEAVYVTATDPAGAISRSFIAPPVAV